MITVKPLVLMLAQFRDFFSHYHPDEKQIAAIHRSASPARAYPMTDPTTVTTMQG